MEFEADIDGVIQYLGQDVAGVITQEFEIYLPVGFHYHRERIDKGCIPYGFRSGYSDVHIEIVVKNQLLLCTLHGGGNALCVWKKLPACRCQNDIMGTSYKQRSIELCFERPDPCGYSSLGYEQLFGGFAEITKLGQLEKGFYVSQIHFYFLDRCTHGEVTAEADGNALPGPARSGRTQAYGRQKFYKD